jgi:hypothetical protein
MKDTVAATGKLKITLIGEDGNVKQTVDVKNLIVNIGKEFIASRMTEATMAPVSHMAVGSGMVIAMPTDTLLGSQIERVALTSISVLSRTITYIGTFPAGVATGALTEAGLFNASTGGTMLARTTFGVFNKEPTDLLTIEWDVTVN